LLLVIREIIEVRAEKKETKVVCRTRHVNAKMLCFSRCKDAIEGLNYSGVQAFNKGR